MTDPLGNYLTVHRWSRPCVAPWAYRSRAYGPTLLRRRPNRAAYRLYVQTRSSTPEPYTRGVDIGPEQAPIVIEPIEAPVPVERAPAVPATPAPVEEPVPA